MVGAQSSGGGIHWYFDVPERCRENAATGLTLGAEHIKGEADKTCPRLSGVLSSSAKVVPASPADLQARMGYGGAASAYAVVQHEHDDFDHSRSTNPAARGHWLTLTLAEQAQRVIEFVARSVSGGW